MKKISRYVMLLPLVAIMASCASIFSRTSYPVMIESAQRDTRVSIYDRNNTLYFSGLTPMSINLSASAGYFQKAFYRLEFTKDGYKTTHIPITANIDGLYFLNFLGGIFWGVGFIGFLIVDPSTGAMWKINQRHVYVDLEREACAPQAVVEESKNTSEAPSTYSVQSAESTELVVSPAEESRVGGEDEVKFSKQLELYDVE